MAYLSDWKQPIAFALAGAKKGMPMLSILKNELTGETADGRTSLAARPVHRRLPRRPRGDPGRQRRRLLAQRHHPPHRCMARRVCAVEDALTRRPRLRLRLRLGRRGALQRAPQGREARGVGPHRRAARRYEGGHRARGRIPRVDRELVGAAARREEARDAGARRRGRRRCPGLLGGGEGRVPGDAGAALPTCSTSCPRACRRRPRRRCTR